MTLFAKLIVWITTTACSAQPAADGRFRVYCFDTTLAGNTLSRYDYDGTWADFMKTINLKKASFVLNDRDIAWYDWQKQKWLLTDSGIEKLAGFGKKNGYLSHLTFIVTLDYQRLYAGEFLSFMSAMAINHPVIHYDAERISGHQHVIRIYPAHTIGNLAELPDAVRKRTARPDVRQYFERIGKLR